MAVQTEWSLSEDVSASAAVGSRRAEDWFAGLPTAQAALELASARHANQYREIDHAPFIVHPIEVGRLLYCDGRPPDVIAAGCSTTSSSRPRHPALSSDTVSARALRGSWNRSQTIHRLPAT